MNRLKNNGKGFTIIEVVLVLAIAGLIFLVVFLALPALQRGQRDTQRKNDLGRFTSQVTSFQSNNQGQLPANAAAWTSFISNYLTTGGSTFAEPSSGTTYAVTASATLPVSTTAPNFSGANQNTIYVYTGAKCDPANASGVSANAGSRNYAALIYQEQGGFSCLDNR